MRTITLDYCQATVDYALTTDAIITVRYIDQGKRRRVTYTFSDAGQAKRFAEALA
jgi:hypothetical protein